MRDVNQKDPSTRPTDSLRVSPREKIPLRLKFLKFWFPVFLYSGIIFCISSVPDLGVPSGIPNLDKLVHIVEYMIFGVLLARALTDQWPGLNILQVATVCSLLYGLSDEFHQSFVPGREAGLPDLIADTIGGFLGAYIYLFFKNRNSNRHNKAKSS